jgi:hypothetical protein
MNKTSLEIEAAKQTLKDLLYLTPGVSNNVRLSMEKAIDLFFAEEVSQYSNDEFEATFSNGGKAVDALHEYIGKRAFGGKG